MLKEFSLELNSLLLNANAQQSAWRVIATSSIGPNELLSANPAIQELLTVLATLAIHLPALSERSADVPLLAQAIIEDSNLRNERQLQGCSVDALERIASYAWPGQLAELRVALNEAREKCAGYVIQATDLPSYLMHAQEQADVSSRCLTNANRLAQHSGSG